MARHEDGYRVSSICGAHGPHRSCVTQLFRQLSVTPGFAKRYGKQRLPYIFLERCTSHIESHREYLPLASKVLFKLSLCIKKNRMSLIRHHRAQTDTVWLVILPENSYQSLVA